MKLEVFVADTLLEITRGVERAQKEAGVWIAPGRVEGKEETTAQLVKFEVAVTASNDTHGGIHILSLADAGGKKSHEYRNTISFSVPVYFQAPKSKPD